MQFNDGQEVIPMSRETFKFYVKLKFEKLSNLFHDLKCIEIISVYLLLFCLKFLHVKTISLYVEQISCKGRTSVNTTRWL